MYIVFSFFVLVLMVGALADMITLDSARIKHLPKLAWIILVILLPLVGGALWFIVGREYISAADRGVRGGSHRWAPPAPTDSLGLDNRGRENTGRDYRGRDYAGRKNSGSDFSVRDTEAELAALDREIAAHERAERIRKLEDELAAKRRAKGASS